MGSIKNGGSIVGSLNFGGLLVGPGGFIVGLLNFGGLLVGL